MFRLIRLVFTALLSFSRSIASRVNAPDHIKCMSLNDEQCMIQPTLINLHPNEYIERSCYYPFPVNLDRCMGSCNTLNGLSYKVCVQNKTEHLNLNVFIMITGICESKILTKYHANVNVTLTVENLTRIKSGIVTNFSVSAKIQKKIIDAKILYFES